MCVSGFRGAVAALFFAVVASSAGAAESGAAGISGFLGNQALYAKLQPVEIREGVSAKRWVSPEMNGTAFHSVLVDDVVFYPEAKPGPQVSAQTLQQITAHVSGQLRGKVGMVLQLASAPGPGVLRVQAAITGVDIATEGMKPRELLPVAAVFGGIKAAAGERDRDVRVFVEARFHDSTSGVLLGVAMRELEGQDLEGKKDQLSLDDVRGSLDQAAEDAAGSLAMALTGPAP